MKRARTAVATAKPGRSTLKRKKASRNNELPASSSTLATTALDDVHFPVEQDNDEDAPMGTFDIDDMDLSHGRDDDEDADDAAASDASSIAGEDPQERRIRLAKQYIASLSRPSSTTHASSSSTSLADIPEFDAAEVDRDIIAARLRDHALEAEGRLHKPMAATLQPGPIPPSTIHHLRGGNVFRHSVTCVAVTPDERYVYAGSKCGRVVKFDVVERRVAQVVADVGRKGGSVRAIAVSHDGKYVAVGCKDLRVYGRGVGAAGEDQLLKTFKHHRDHVTALAFRVGTNTLFSASADRTVKTYSIDDLAYTETLFGHQDTITALDVQPSSARDRCLTTGGRDKTVRLWKIAEESQLVFRATPRPPRANGEDMSRARAMLERDDTGSLDVCAMVDDEVWVTGSDGGALAVWSAQRKKPMFVLPNAHGRDVAIANAVESEGNEHGGENDVALATTTTSATSVYGTALHIHLDRDNADATHLSHVSADDVTSNPYWITAVAAMRHSDVVASGSSDGMVRLWRVNVKNEVEEDVHEDAHEADGDIENLEDNKSDDATATTAAHQFSLPTKPTRQQRRPMLEQIATAHVPGFINALAFAPSGTHLFAAVGQEHKLGRWEKVKRARNGVAVIPLQLK